MKTRAYAAWLIVSLVVLAVLRDVARSEFPSYAAIVMGVAFAAVIYSLFVIRRHFSQHQSTSMSPTSPRDSGTAV